MTDHPVHRDDITALREEGDLRAYVSGLRAAGRAQLTDSKPQPKKRPPRKPPYHVPRPGAWPCGTAPSGPTPEPCSNCPPALASHDARITAWTNRPKETSE